MFVPGIFLAAQPPQFSIATDVGLLRSFRENQRFISFGHTIQVQYHISNTDGLYGWLSYYTNGKFRNDLTATAKSPLTSPQEINYTNDAHMGFRQFSMGYKKFFTGSYQATHGVNLYGYAGFGILFGKVDNRHSQSIDSTDYQLPVHPGLAKFKRLTLDLGLGTEFPLGADIFLYTEGRTWIPATDYPSKYVLVNDNSPLAGMFNAGIRILF